MATFKFYGVNPRAKKKEKDNLKFFFLTI